MQIMSMTNTVCEKRHEFNLFMLSLLNKQMKERAEEAERVNREKQRPTVDRAPNDLRSILVSPSGGTPSRHQQLLNRDNQIFNIKSDEDNFLLHTGREEREEEV